MKSSIWCAFMIAMFLVASAAFGEIVWDGDWDYETSGGGGANGTWNWSTVGASAIGDNTLSWGYASGWETWYTTEYAHCRWEWRLYLYGETHVWFQDDEYCHSWATGEANGRDPFNYKKKFYGFVLINPDDHKEETHVVKEFGEFEDFHQGNYEVPAYSSVDGDHLAGAYGLITAGSASYTYGHVCANTFCFMEEVE